MRGKHAARARLRREAAMAELRASYEQRLGQEADAHALAEEALAVQIEQLRADRDRVAETLAAKAVAVAEHEADRVEVAAQQRHEELVAEVLKVIRSDYEDDEPWRPGRAQTRWLSTYQCPCGSWHVGDQRPTLQRKITAAGLPKTTKRGRRP